MEGAFTTAKDRYNDNALVFVQYLKSTGAKLNIDSIMQSYIQFKDWDNMSTVNVPSFMNWVCNTSVPAAASSTDAVSVVGSCGATTLISKQTGPYTNVKGTVTPNETTCNMSSLLAAGSSFESDNDKS